MSSICVLGFEPVEKGCVVRLAPLSFFSIGPLISRKQGAHNAADLDGSGDKGRDPEVVFQLLHIPQNRFSHKSLKRVSSWEILGGQLVLFNSAVEGLTAAFYSVLELSIPREKLSNNMVWARRSLPRWIAPAEAHHAPSDEAMTGGFVFVPSFHCEGFSCVARTEG